MVCISGGKRSPDFNELVRNPVESFFRFCQQGILSGVCEALELDPKAITWRDEKAGQRTGLMHAAQGGHVKVLERLAREKNIDLDAKNERGSTALMFACQARHAAAADFLLSQGAKVDEKNQGGTTALMTAAWEGHADLCLLLVRNDADIDARDNNRNTALILAASNGQEEACMRLLKLGADKDLRNSDRRTAAEEAQAAGYKDLARKIRDYQAADFLALAAKGDFKVLIEELKSSDGDPNLGNAKGSTLLMFACMNGTAEDVKALLTLGAEPNIANAQLMTPLMVAASEGKVEICSALVRAGARTGDKNNEQTTAADLARENGYDDLADAIAAFRMPKPQEKEKTIAELVTEFNQAVKKAELAPAVPAPKQAEEPDPFLKKLRKGKLTG